MIIIKFMMVSQQWTPPSLTGMSSHTTKTRSKVIQFCTKNLPVGRWRKNICWNSFFFSLSTAARINLVLELISLGQKTYLIYLYCLSLLYCMHHCFFSLSLINTLFFLLWMHCYNDACLKGILVYISSTSFVVIWKKFSSRDIIK